VDSKVQNADFYQAYNIPLAQVKKS